MPYTLGCYPLRMSRWIAGLLMLSSVAWAGEKYLKNDSFTGQGSVNSGVEFGEYEGAGVLLEGAPSDYPLRISTPAKLW